MPDAISHHPGASIHCQLAAKTRHPLQIRQSRTRVQLLALDDNVQYVTDLIRSGVRRRHPDQVVDPLVNEEEVGEDLVGAVDAEVVAVDAEVVPVGQFVLVERRPVGVVLTGERQGGAVHAIKPLAESALHHVVVVARDRTALCTLARVGALVVAKRLLAGPDRDGHQPLGLRCAEVAANRGVGGVSTDDILAGLDQTSRVAAFGGQDVVDLSQRDSLARVERTQGRGGRRGCGQFREGHNARLGKGRGTVTGVVRVAGTASSQCAQKHEGSDCCTQVKTTEHFVHAP